MSKLILDDLFALSRRALNKVIMKAKASTCSGKLPLFLVDATVGNGVDTEFLARLTGTYSGLCVLGFDIQADALEKTSSRIAACGFVDKVKLVQASHALLGQYVPLGGKVLAAMYNLGFLPGGDAQLTTKPESTLASLQALELLLVPGGVISVHAYTGQENGQEELAVLEQWATNLNWKKWRVARYAFCNKPVNQEVLFLAYRL